MIKYALKTRTLLKVKEHDTDIILFFKIFILYSQEDILKHR